MMYLSLLTLFWSCSGLTFATIIFDPVKNTCGSNAASGGSALLQDVTNMGSYSKKLMDDVASGNLLQQNPWEFYRVMAAYNSFFDFQHPDGQARYDDVKGKLEVMGNLRSSSPDVFVACDDDPFWDASNPQVLVFHDPNTNTDVNFAPGQILTCAAGNTNGKNQIGYRFTVNNVNYIMLCLKHNGGHDTLSSLTNAEGDALNDKTTLSSVLFHELSHAAIPSMRGDQSGGTAVGGERYGWLGSRDVRSTYANENPDSLTLFAIALSLDDYFWDTGLAETKQTVYQRLQQQAPNDIKNMNLPPP